MKERVEKYENILDGVNQILDNLENDIDLLESKISDIKDLDKYYQSEDWLNDRDKSKKLKIKCGVLSEDAVWNLFDKINDLEERIRETNFIINKTQP